MKITWKIVNEFYLNYLRDNYESRIPYSNYGDDKYKPFFSPLFEINDLIYITQISHPQKRHYELKKNIDFYKIYHPNDGRLLAVINLNYMFPIHNSLMADLRYKSIENYRLFKYEEEKSKYIDLLRIELNIINKLPLQKNAFKIYNMKYKYPDNFISQRSFDFKKLEDACFKYLDANDYKNLLL
ncbi:MAG: type III toxin-antitoxin system ToxN/AbiQ family toxin [Clostridium sp.]|uniref:type III toxin-antitoxin system ToxN/AbiQ family toxin n=1 Tax=Clostridium sp. TaxID=1506 RepID=UPI0025B7B0A9|nr:type III toxin-antitoxin system ToxN/AbiQ family toxin [Clostridium sp.]MCE5220065.1 type III toxin-antitoxin system ToxN/AbiQ family toxin [Clostridium sp.]